MAILEFPLAAINGQNFNFVELSCIVLTSVIIALWLTTVFLWIIPLSGRFKGAAPPPIGF